MCETLLNLGSVLYHWKFNEKYENLCIFMVVKGVVKFIDCVAFVEMRHFQNFIVFRRCSCSTGHLDFGPRAGRPDPRNTGAAWRLSVTCQRGDDRNDLKRQVLMTCGFRILWCLGKHRNTESGVASRSCANVWAFLTECLGGILSRNSTI